MRRDLTGTVAAGALLLLLPAASAQAATSRVIALLASQDHVGDGTAAAALDLALRFELSRYGELIASETARSAQRQLRLRNIDGATPDRLRGFGETLDADWIVSATLHEAESGERPRAAVSGRVYAIPSGELIWAGFGGAGGLDGARFLGLGGISQLDRLVTSLARELVSEQAMAPVTSSRQPATGARLGPVAIVPFTGATEYRASAHAQTVTEAVRAQLWKAGVALVSPNLAHQSLRRVGGRWGGVSAEARAALRETANASSVLTGTVEVFDTGPRPRVAVAMRLLAAGSGRIVWNGWKERDERRPRLLGLGGTSSASQLAGKIVEGLVGQLLQDGALTESEIQP